DEGGQELGSETSVKIQALYKEDEGSRYELFLSSKACVRLPKNKGTLLVTLPANRKALVHRHEQGGSSQLLRKKLVSSPSFQTAFPCGEDGFFSNQNLTHKWNFESSDNLQSMKLEVLARDAQRQTSFPLFVKGFGETAVNLPPTLDTSKLNEGIYQLEVNAYDLLDGFGEIARPLIKNTGCPLTILRSPPLVGGSLEQKVLPVLEPGKALPWTIEQPNSQLYACIEERSGLGDPSLAAPAACQAQSKCSKVESFKPVSAISSDRAGLFDVFAFARDRAGNDSPLRCQTVAFSTSAPALTLKWERESWNQEGAFMRDLDAFIKAKVSIGSHDVLTEDTLKKTFECKVEFILQGKDTLSGKDVICTQGRCRGQSLSKFTPCDPDIEFTLQEAWQQPAIQQSMMRLVVRAQDGAGHVSEVARSIWINNRSWNIQRLEYKQDGKAVDASQLIQDPSGQFLAAFANGTVRRWDGNAWVDVTPKLPEKASGIMLFISPERVLYAQFTRWGDEEKNFTVQARWDGIGWEFIPAPDPSLPNPCSFVNIAKSGFYCANSNYIYHFDGKKWGAGIPKPELLLQGQSCYFPVVIDFQNRFWQLCDNRLFVWSNGPRWQPAVSFMQDRQLSLGSIFADSADRVWVYAWSLQEKVFGYFTDVNSFEPITLPKGKSGQTIPCTPTLAHDGRIVCERYFLNPMSLDWQLLPEFEHFDYKIFARLNPGYGGTEAFAPIKSSGSPIHVWAAPADGFYIATGSHVKHWPSTLTQAFLNNLSSIYRDKDGALWLNASFGRNGPSTIHRIKAQPVVTYDQNILGLSHGMLPLPWEDAEGDLKMAFFDHGIYKFKDGTWQQESHGLPTGAEHYINFESSDGTIYSANLTDLWFRPKNASTFTLLNAKPLEDQISFDSFEESEDGAVWFHVSGYTKQVHRVINGKIQSQDLPAEETDYVSGILKYRGRIVFKTKSSFYWADSAADGRIVLSRFNPEVIGLVDLAKSTMHFVRKISSNFYLMTAVQEDGTSIHFLGNTREGKWESFNAPHSDFYLSGNDSGIMFAWVGDGRILKRTSSGDWIAALTPDQIRSYSSQNSYYCWIKVDRLGRLWIHTGGPWLIARLDE
ncbi:MAG TPA: hypothetical protein VFO10_27580, partial [Oligoflexus sp.]|uniref:hypothetical protein n=1 Tax=Oligoflexus sp. TaxID=1971216 RepID=UPI002D80A130